MAAHLSFDDFARIPHEVRSRDGPREEQTGWTLEGCHGRLGVGILFACLVFSLI